MRKSLCILLWVAGWSIPAHALLPDPNPLTAAATAGDTAAVGAALAGGTAIETRNAEGWTPLICAVHAGKTEVVRLLLSKHANPSTLSRVGCAPLDFAMEDERWDIATMLIEAGADPNGFRGSPGSTFRSPLFRAMYHHQPAMIELLLAHGARLEDKNVNEDTVLMEVCKLRFTDEARLLIEHGANVNARRTSGHTALIFAAYNGLDDTIALLLAHGADVHAQALDDGNGKTFGALEVATEQGYPYAIEALTDAGAKPAQPKNPLIEQLTEAIDLDDYERAQAAVGNGASPNALDSIGRSAMMVAALKGNPSMVQMLIKAGGDVNADPTGDPRDTCLALAQEMIRDAKTPPDKARCQRVAEVIRQAGATR